MTRILIADPTPSSRSALSIILSHKLGMYNIGEVGDTDALIRALADNPPDVLMLDWRLYGAPAPETCRLLRKAYPIIKIVLLSVNAEDRQQALDAGAAFIYKGASPDDTLAVLEPLLKGIEERLE